MLQDGDTDVWQEKYVGKMNLDKILGCKINSLPIPNPFKKVKLTLGSHNNT